MEFLKLDLQRFGASANKSVELHSNSYPSSFPYTLKASFTENSTSIENNTSNITVTASLTSSGIRWQTSYNSTLQVYWYDNKTGSETLKATITFAGMEYNTTKTATATFDVEHKGDGTLSGYAKAVFTKGSTTAGTACNSGNISTDSTALTTIARASTPSLSSNNFKIGDSITLTTNRKSTSFTHTVVLTFGSYTKTYTNVGDSQVINTSQFATDMYAQIPNAKSGTGTITTTTYSGSTQIGSASTLNFTANAVEGNVNPQVTMVTWSVDSTTSSLANNTTIIKGVTTATIRVTANSRSSSTLKKIFLWYYSGTNKVVLSSKTVNSNTTASFTINNVSVSKIYPAATDSRGYTTYITTSQIPVTFKDYVTLTADTNANIRRIVQTEPNVRINSFTGNYWNKSFGSQSNTLTIKWKYKETTASTYSAEYTIPAGSISINNNKYTISNYTLTNGTTTELFNYQKSYHVQISVTDKIGTKTVVYTITAGQPNFAVFPSASLVNSKKILTTDDTMVLSDQLPSNGVWQKICNIVIKSHAQGEFYHIRLYFGQGNNGRTNQNAYIDLIGQKAWTGNYDGRAGWNAELHPINSPFSRTNVKVKVIANSVSNYDVWFYTSFGYCRVSYLNLNNGNNVIVTKKFDLQTTEPTGTACNLLLSTVAGYYSSNGMRIGLWDDKALYRKKVYVTLPNGATDITIENAGTCQLIMLEFGYFNAPDSGGNNRDFPVPFINDAGKRVTGWGIPATGKFHLVNEITGYVGCNCQLNILYTLSDSNV